ncbi:hypothetical protein SAMN04488066_10756 [Halorubrum aquaticum]|uniref:DUF7311 domain-containing protein n=1 Tax=Halorubrum aquaticum TaxID=387340 RepID=A0A1I3ASX5_9EURY|nr:hypothetical protein [Halorubrum aquaticum]SFH52839.1 hypothetical protein SAMN04488066_10756 [Halorubrum aquaticum]
MIRVVLTVLLAVALLAVSMPALEDARTDTTVERLGTETDRIERVAGALTADSVAVEFPSLAARTSLVVSAPTGFAAAPIDRLVLADPARTDAVVGGRVPDDSVVLRYRLRHGPVRSIPIAPPTDAIGISLDGAPIELEPGGETGLELRLVDDDGPTVRVARDG